MDQANNQNSNQPNSYKPNGKRIAGEVITGILLFLVPLVCAFYFAIHSNNNNTEFNNKVLLVFFAVALIGVSFLNLAYIRGFPKPYQSRAIWGSRGGFLAFVAMGIEWLLGIRD